jgi:cold shock CspA family protein
MEEERGVIKVVFDKGFGFIRDRFGAEHFFHARQCDDGLFESLKPGDEVIYHLAMGRSGRPCAEGVKRAAA